MLSAAWSARRPGDPGALQRGGEGHREGYRQRGARERGAQCRADLPDRALRRGSLPGCTGGNIAQHRAGELGRGQPEPESVDDQRDRDEPTRGRGLNDQGECDHADQLEGQPDQHGAGGTEARGEMAGRGAGEERSDRHPGEHEARAHDVEPDRS